MKIRMLSTQNGSLDGIRVKEYAVGTEHDLTSTPGARDLAKAFVGARMAIEVKPEPAPATPAPAVTMTAEQSDAREVSELQPAGDAKAIEAAPENKMIDVAPANKRKGKK